MTKPNFFIIGAPKCGTTSLASWLAEHPNVFMSPVKEPNFFNTDMKKHRNFTHKEYNQLFANAESHHFRVGEASSNYLYSKDAVPNILDYVDNSSDVKFIVSIRNPIDMAVSWHGEMLRSGHEVVKNFSKAWHLQEKRAEGKSLPTFSEQASLLYGPICQLGTQLERVLHLVDNEKVHIVVLDDLKADAMLEYEKILDFLGLTNDGRKQFLVYNEARSLHPWAARFTLVVNWVKGRFHIRRGFGLNKSVNRRLFQPGGKALISSEMHEELRKYFKNDIAILGKILDRDFSNWLKYELDER
jgi:hypothetical protein